MISKVIQFIKKDIWYVRKDELPRAKAFFVRQLQMILVSVKGFAEDKCQSQASALTYYTLLSIVPVVALAFAIAKGFGLEKNLQIQLMDGAEGHEEILTQVFAFANNMLENTKGGLIAGIGVILLIWSVVKVLGNIESAFNDIWQVKRGRTWMRKLTEYTAIMLFAPLVLVLSGASAILGQLMDAVGDSFLGGVIGPAVHVLIMLVPYVMVWVLFTFVYLVMPNTKVDVKSALIAGIIAGTAFQISEWAYIEFQVGMSSYNAIYGSFAALPLFLIWTRISWLITLFGAELAFANQNVQRYEFELDSENVSYRFRKLTTLAVAHLLVKNFEEGTKPLTSSELAVELKMPIRLVRQAVFELTETGILSEIKIENSNESAYQPALGTDKITVHFVLEKIGNKGYDQIPVGESGAVKELRSFLEEFDTVIASSSSNKLLKDIV